MKLKVQRKQRHRWPEHYSRAPYRSGKAARSASPAVHRAAPSKTTSLMRNWPGTADRAGKPSDGSMTPGVENRKLRVVRNIPTASALPTAESLAENGRAAISTAVNSSMAPKIAENCPLLNNG